MIGCVVILVAPNPPDPIAFGTGVVVSTFVILRVVFFFFVVFRVVFGVVFLVVDSVVEIVVDIVVELLIVGLVVGVMVVTKGTGATPPPGRPITGLAALLVFTGL